MRKIFPALLLLLALGASAQSFTVVTATNVLVDNGSGTAVHPPGGSSLCFLGVNNQGTAITYTPSGGSPVSGTVCQTLTSGALSGSLQVANGATASPLGLLFTITVINGGTTYLTIPMVSVSGSLFSFDAFALQGTQSALGFGFAHLACSYGARWTSTSLPLGENAQVCNASGQWEGFPPNPYCPTGNAYLVPQSGGTAFCVPPALSGFGVPSGLCVNNSTYNQQDATAGANFWLCVGGTWEQQAGGGGGGMVYPGAGIGVSTGSAWAASLSETEDDIIFGAGGSWTKGTALPNGTTATTQSPGDNSTKVATTAFVLANAGGTHQWACQPGFGDGLNAITAATYLQTTCRNTTGSTVTLTGISCYADVGSSTVNASAHTLGALLTGAITCTSSFAAGTQSANVLLTNGDYINFTFVADGTSTQSTWVVKGTY